MSEFNSEWCALVNNRLEQLEADLKLNTEATKKVAENTSDVVAAFKAAAGAFKVLELLGKIAKPLLWIVAGYAAWKTGGLTALLAFIK